MYYGPHCSPAMGSMSFRLSSDLHRNSYPPKKHLNMMLVIFDVIGLVAWRHDIYARRLELPFSTGVLKDHPLAIRHLKSQRFRAATTLI